MSSLEKSIVIAAARERTKLIQARLQVVHVELQMVLIELNALQSQLHGPLAIEHTEQG